MRVNYEGEKALLATFDDKANVVTGTPSILISPDTLEVIGYLPTE